MLTFGKSLQPKHLRRKIERHFTVGTGLSPHRICQPRAKTPDQGVVGGDPRLCRSRVALPGAATDQLTIDAARIMALADHDVKPAAGDDFRSQPDIGAASCQIRGNRDRTRLTGASHDICLGGILPSIQEFQCPPSPAKHLCEAFAVFDAPRADQNGPASRVYFGDALGQRLPFGGRRSEEAGRQDPATTRCA